jgi:oxygen-dependent protoporphyrinogen oxidase
MIGAINPELRKVTVVGAGISGLLLADVLDRLGYEVTLYEAAPRAGGLIESAATPWGLAESAAHSLLATPAVRELCVELGVELVEVAPDSRARYIWRGGALRRFPLGPLELLRTLLRVLLVRAPRGQDTGEWTLERWTLRFLGPAALEYLLTPFVRGIFAAAPSELTIANAFPALRIAEGKTLFGHLLGRFFRARPPGSGDNANGVRDEKPGGARKEKRKMVSPLGGVGRIPEALAQRLRARLGDRFRLGERLETLPPGAGREYNIALCVPAGEAAKLLQDRDPELSRALLALPYAPLVTATVFAPLAGFRTPPRGVGVLVPASETGRRCLGILFNSSAFAGRVQASTDASFTVMLSPSPLLNEELPAVVAGELRALLGFEGEPHGVFAKHWERAIPLYGEAQLRLMQKAWAGWCSGPGQLLFGNYTGEVSLRGMIESARLARATWPHPR